MSEDHYGSDDQEGVVNEFRIVFKKYKKRVPAPDFSQVIDIRESGNLAKFGLESRFLYNSKESDFEDDDKIAEKLGLLPLSEWRCCEFVDRPGLYLLPGLLKRESTPTWLERTFGYADPPNTTNLTAHGTVPSEKGWFLDHGVKSLRWTTLGVEYDWNTKEYPKKGRELPEELKLLAKLVSKSLNLGEMQPDAAIVNYYPPKSTLSPHVDRSERSDAPLISLSLGQTAVYLTGGTSLSEPPIPIWLRSGDVLVMHSDQRLVYHAIPCVAVPSQVERFKYDGNKKIEDYLNSSRVNITIRQVNPS